MQHTRESGHAAVARIEVSHSGLGREQRRGGGARRLERFELLPALDAVRGWLQHEPCGVDQADVAALQPFDQVGAVRGERMYDLLVQHASLWCSDDRRVVDDGRWSQLGWPGEWEFF